MIQIEVGKIPQPQEVGVLLAIKAMAYFPE